MASGQYKVLFSVTRPAARDLSSYQYCAAYIDSDGNIDYCDVSNNEDVLGILENKPAAAGEEAQVAVLGTCLFKTGGAISINDLLQSNSSYVAAAVTADKARYFAQALEAATASGDYIEVLLMGGTRFIGA